METKGGDRKSNARNALLIKDPRRYFSRLFDAGEKYTEQAYALVTRDPFAAEEVARGAYSKVPARREKLAPSAQIISDLRHFIAKAAGLKTWSEKPTCPRRLIAARCWLFGPRRYPKTRRGRRGRLRPAVRAGDRRSDIASAARPLEVAAGPAVGSAVKASSFSFALKEAHTMPLPPRPIGESPRAVDAGLSCRAARRSPTLGAGLGEIGARRSAPAISTLSPSCCQPPGRWPASPNHPPTKVRSAPAAEARVRSLSSAPSPQARSAPHSSI
jgi:hypothetical protein